jgi:asparagine synthase (glutamine-hydrolysing)
VCGITGILRLAPSAAIERDTVAAMTRALVHRGPDDEGFYDEPRGRCALGFRRLSIIDLDTGHQPISNEDGTIWVVLNGEIYNYRELRAALQARGHRFRTQSDTEVIVHLFEEAGEACLDRLAGMFAIAIWDARRGQLTLARDRFGKKPLAYAVHGQRLYFGSELKALRAAPDMPRELDAQSLHRYLVFQYVPAPHTIYRGIHKLPPGCVLTVAADRPFAASPRAWWTPPRARFFGTEHDALERLDALLTRAVEKRLIADVPLGAFLSGGMDSSIVVMLMRRLGVSPLRTFTIGFNDAKYDERAFARLVAREVGAEHHEHIVTPDAAGILDTLAHHYDEPFADSSAIPTYYVSKWARERVTVALTGDAGDECFAGYDRYRAARLAASFDWLPAGVRAAIAALAAHVPHARPKTRGNRFFRFATALACSRPRRYLAWINIFTPDQLATGYRGDFRAQLDFDEPLSWFDALYAAAGSSDPVESANYADIVSYLPYDLLCKVDTASMACSLECRSPFLDHDLVAFATSLPARWRLGKAILRRWAARYVPREVLARPKMGFGVPVGAWMRSELAPLLRDRVLAPDSISRRVFRADWLGALVESHISGRSNHEHPLWALLMLELWARRWGPSVPT